MILESNKISYLVRMFNKILLKQFQVYWLQNLKKKRGNLFLSCT